MQLSNPCDLHALTGVSPHYSTACTAFLFRHPPPLRCSLHGSLGHCVSTVLPPAPESLLKSLQFPNSSGSVTCPLTCNSAVSTAHAHQTAVCTAHLSTTMHLAALTPPSPAPLICDSHGKPNVVTSCIWRADHHAGAYKGIHSKHVSPSPFAHH